MTDKTTPVTVEGDKSIKEAVDGLDKYTAPSGRAGLGGPIGTPTAAEYSEAPGKSDLLEVNIVLLTVKKKTSEVAVEVAEHEVPILRHIHGFDAIKIVERYHGTQFIDARAEAELQRLQAKYDDKNQVNVAVVFDSPEKLAALVDGLTVNEDMLSLEAQQPEASMSIDNRATANKAAAKTLAAKKATGKR